MNSTASSTKTEQQLRDMNEALLVSSVRQHELTEQAQKAEAALRESEQQLARELAATRQLQSASALLIEGGDTDALYQKIVEAAAAIMCSDGASMQMLDEGKNALRLLAFRGFDPAFGQIFAFNRLDSRTSCSVASREGQRVIVPDVETCDFIVGTTALQDHRRTGIRAVQSTPLFSRDGRMLGVISTHWRTPHTPTENDLRPFDILARQAADLLERKQAEKALRESEERYRTLVEQVKDYAIFRTDPEGRATTWNEGVERVLGFEEAEFIGTDIAPTIFTPEDVQGDTAHKELEQAAAHGTASDDRWMRRKDGTRFFAAGTTTALRDEIGRLLGFTKVMRDQTVKKRADEAMALLAAIVTSSEDAIISKDVDGIITSWNKGAERLFGYAAEEVIGKSVTLLVPHDQLDEEPRILERIRRGEVVEHYETVQRRKDGSLLDISLTISPMRDAAGRIIGASKIARDITERRRLEKQTQEQAAALADLHRRKDEFLAMLSHELRNPLAPISNAVQLLRLQRESENQIAQQARSIIERQVGQLKHLVDDLLEISRITTGRVQLRQERIAVTGIVDQAVETARPLIQQRRVELTLSLPPQPVWLYADASRLEQVVVNLLTNAAKYTDEGGHIWLTVQQEGDAAVLRVRDTGIGIAPELLPRIFDLFTQAERSLDRSQGGLGIGLCLVQRLVELHGGTVETYSVLGQGSEFVVRLPVAPTSAPQPPATLTEAAQPTASLRVLVVDDNVDAAESLALLLQASGHDVRTAHDGPSALAAARNYRPDVVLLDIGLPGLNGFDVAKWMRQQPPLQNLVLVAMTGYGQEADRQRSHEAGFDHHLIKPADFKDLQRILKSVSEQATR